MQLSDVSTDGDRWTMKMEMEMMEGTMMGRGGVVVMDVEEKLLLAHLVTQECISGWHY